MGLTSTIKQWYIKTLPGMNNLVEDLDLKDRWVEVAQNCRFEEEPGSVDKRAPVTYFNSTTMGSAGVAVTGLTRYYTSGGTSVFVAVHDTTAYVGSDTGGTWASIRTGLTTGKRCSFVTYKDLLIVSNGYDNPWVYDGSSDNVTWELGACKGVTSTSSTGSLDASADYKYQVGIVQSTAYEYICGAVSNVVSSGTAKAIELTEIPLGPSGTDSRKIYRTEGGGSSYYLIDTIADNTTVVYTDTVGDTTATAIGSVTDDMPVGAEIRIHRERMFMTRDPSNPNKIYYSNVYLPHYIQQTTNLDYMEISPEDGDEISGIPIQLGSMVCIKKNSIRKLHVTSAVSGADPTTWYADDPIAWHGCPAPWSITQTPQGIVFLGWDHWYLFNGAATQSIIDEFDTKDILDANYDDVVGFFHKGIMLAAYSDKTIANQFNDRMMRYNFKRMTLSYDLWTSSTLSGANCFAAKTGDDETGELYFGDSQAGYVVKDKESENNYRLRTKTDCNEGTIDTVFVGGTESSPYMEIGSETAAQTIPDDIIIFWDDDGTTPGSGWTEITGTEDHYICIATSSSTAAATTHNHTITGELASSSPATVNGGDNDQSGGLKSPHSHSANGTSSSTSCGPRYVKYRLFKADGCTDTEFPDGAIVMWDQETAPTGYQSVSNVGYYIQQGTAGLGTPNSSSHTHTFSYTSGSGPGDNHNSVSGTNGCHGSHTHDLSGSLYSVDQDDWELDYAQLHFIKKVGEADTWDGTNKYVMCLVAGSSTAITGWTAVSSTYGNMYLKIGNSAPSTGSAENAAHDHQVSSGVSGSSNTLWGGTYHVTQIYDDHTHSLDLACSSGDSEAPATIKYRLYRYHLGKMKGYNAASTSAETAGTWTSPTMNIKAETLNKMFWNESLSTGDDIKFHTRSGATSSACTAASWSAAISDPNGSIIPSSADDWFQYKIEFTATDTTVTNPRVYFTNGYVTKYTYRIGATNAETSVNWEYNIGFRNFDEPMLDKIFKKIHTVHEGDTGSFTVEWETENTSSSNTFEVDLTENSARWESYFPSTAMGKELKLRFYKNDLNDFRLSEVKGIYSPLPIIS